MRLDSACHFADRSRFTYPWMAEAAPHMDRDFTPEDLERILTRNRFEGAVVSALLDDPAETSWLIGLAEEHPWIRGVLGSPDLPSLDRWQKSPVLRGIVCTVTTPAEVFREIKLRKLSSDLICLDRLAEAVRLAEAWPDLTIVLTETAGARFEEGEFEQWSRLLRPFTSLANVSVKISGLIRHGGPDGWHAETYAPYVQWLMAHFGPDRLLYGSGWPHCMHTGTWKESLAAFTQAWGAQTLEVREKVLGATGARVYGIVPMGSER